LRKEDEVWDLINRATGEIKGYNPKQKRELKEKFVIDFLVRNIQTDLLTSPAFRCILLEMDATNRVVIDKERYEYFYKTYRIKKSLLRYTINKAIKDKLMLRVGNAKYFVSPFNFAKTNFSHTLILRNIYSQVSFELSREPKKDKPNKLKLIKTEVL
jgi:hypothetical protein